VNAAFHSRWGAQLAAFVRFKHALGQTYTRPIQALQCFDRFAVSAHCKQKRDLAAVLTAWLSQYSHRKPITIAFYLAWLRQFCLFRKRYDPDAFVPDRSWMPHPARSGFLPYIFSPDEIRRIIADTANVHGTPRTRRCFRLLVIVLYCTGVRIGEAVALRRRHVDLRNACFMVGPSKGRIRWVPFRRDLARELKTWLGERVNSKTPDDFVFPQDNGRGRSVKHATSILRALLRRCHLKPATGRVGPRCHDMRHTYAVHRLQRWYREGRNLQRMLPWLSAYLGHRNLLGTERYLHATPELLAIASRRLSRELHLGSAPQ
jgi:integrase/recombinase XerD